VQCPRVGAQMIMSHDSTSKESQSKDVSRRTLLKTTAVAATSVGLGANALAYLAPNRTEGVAKKSASANDKIVFGLIGCGGMGAANMRNFMQHEDVEVAALCDVDENRIPGDFKAVESKYGRKPTVYDDYRKMLERKDIDAVIIGTPDHWHALNLVHACEAGKDIYCEKPISHNIREAVAMVGAKKHFKRVVQVGTWQRSTSEFHQAIEYIRAGKLGKIVHCRAWITDGQALGKTQPKDVPAGFNYDMWMGPSEMRPYRSNTTHYNWRWMKTTGGGQTTDWGVHMMDIALLGMSKDQDLVMPDRVSTVGGLWAYTDDDRTAADSVESIMHFSGANEFALTWSVLRDVPGKPSNGTEFVSVDGRTLRVWRGGWEILDPNGKKLEKTMTDPQDSDHWRNFLDCVKSRETPRATLESVAQTTIVCHLSNASLYSGKMVRFDKSKMDIVGRDGKDNLAYDKQYRKGYSLKVYK
jgi:predicted dehydrogenase